MPRTEALGDSSLLVLEPVRKTMRLPMRVRAFRLYGSRMFLKARERYRAFWLLTAVALRSGHRICVKTRQ